MSKREIDNKISESKIKCIKHKPQSAHLRTVCEQIISPYFNRDVCIFCIISKDTYPLAFGEFPYIL